MLLSDPTPLITVPVIPVVTIERAADAVPLARALLAGGLSVVEITLRTPAALEAVRAILAEVEEIIVGVGTVVLTQTSVVTPQTNSVSISRFFSINSRSVW